MSFEKGLDCSGLIFHCVKRCEDLTPNLWVKRTTAREMAKGKAGWDFEPVNFADVRDNDLVWWSLKPGRPDGHIGVVYDDHKLVLHASGSRGRVVVDLWEGDLLEKITGLGRLTIGR